MISFKLVTGKLGKIKYGPNIEKKIKEFLSKENEEFTDRRAVPSLRKNLRRDILDEITWMIESETRSEMQQCLF